MKKVSEAEQLLNRFSNAAALYLSPGNTPQESEHLKNLMNEARAEILELLNKAMKD